MNNLSEKREVISVALRGSTIAKLEGEFKNKSLALEGALEACIALDPLLDDYYMYDEDPQVVLDQISDVLSAFTADKKSE